MISEMFISKTKNIPPDGIFDANNITHFVFERKPTELENKIQAIIDELETNNNDDIEFNWRRAYVMQLQNIIYQIQINDINPVWIRKEIENET